MSISSDSIILPTTHSTVPASHHRSFNVSLSTVFTPAVLLVQLFSHTRNLHCCFSVTAIIFIQESGALPFNLLETFYPSLLPLFFFVRSFLLVFCIAPSPLPRARSLISAEFNMRFLIYCMGIGQNTVALHSLLIRVFLPCRLRCTTPQHPLTEPCVLNYSSTKEQTVMSR